MPEQRGSHGCGVIEAALEATGADRSRCVVVGDAVWDIQAAVTAGVPSIGLLTGGVSADEQRSAGAAALYEDAATLLAELASSPLRRCAGTGLTDRSG